MPFRRGGRRRFRRGFRRRRSRRSFGRRRMPLRRRIGIRM